MWESESKEVLIIQPDRLGQDASRSIETFLTWMDASYDYPPDGTPDDFSKWLTGKMNAIEEGYRSVLKLPIHFGAGVDCKRVKK